VHLGAGRDETALTDLREAVRRAPDNMDDIELEIAPPSVLGPLGRADEVQYAIGAVADRARDDIQNHISFAPALKGAILQGLSDAGSPGRGVPYSNSQ